MALDRILSSYSESGDAYAALHMAQTLSVRAQKRVEGSAGRREAARLRLGVARALARGSAWNEAKTLVLDAVRGAEAEDWALEEGAIVVMFAAAERLAPRAWMLGERGEEGAEEKGGGGGESVAAGWLGEAVEVLSCYPAGHAATVEISQELLRRGSSGGAKGRVAACLWRVSARVQLASGDVATAVEHYAGAACPEEHADAVVRWLQGARRNEQPTLAAREVLRVLSRGNLADANALRAALARRLPAFDPDGKPEPGKEKAVDMLGKGLARFVRMACRTCEFEAGPLYAVLLRRYAPMLRIGDAGLPELADAVGEKWFALPRTLTAAPAVSPLQALLGAATTGARRDK
jgi:Golgi to ER traffic protein 4